MCPDTTTPLSDSTSKHAEEITVLNKRVKLIQPSTGFRTSMDSVLVAAACPAKPGDTILDLGCGVGSAGLCVLYRVPETTLTGIDIQANHIKLAQNNAALNATASRTNFETADVLTYKTPQTYDHVICNPPYLDAGTHLVSPDQSKAAARSHSADGPGFLKWIDTAYRALRQGGCLTLIHRADHIDRIIRDCGSRFGGTTVIPLWPKAGMDAKRVIIRTVKDRRSAARLHTGLVLHTQDGKYTPEAEKILRDGEQIL